MLDLLTRQLFEPLLNQRFTLHVDDDRRFEVELVEVEALKSAGRPDTREPFALLFRGPRDFFVPQSVYVLDHPQLGAREIFLVPIGPDEVGHRYQAIFN